MFGRYNIDSTRLTSPFGLFASNPMPTVAASSEAHIMYTVPAYPAERIHHGLVSRLDGHYNAALRGPRAGPRLQRGPHFQYSHRFRRADSFHLDGTGLCGHLHPVAAEYLALQLRSDRQPGLDQGLARLQIRREPGQGEQVAE